MWDMTWNLVIFAVAFVALGVLLLVMGARQEPSWRQGGGRGLSHEPMPLSGTDLVMVLIRRAPYPHVRCQMSGAHGLESESLRPRGREAGLAKGITKIVAVYRICPVKLVARRRRALSWNSASTNSRTCTRLHTRLWQERVERYHVFQVT